MPKDPCDTREDAINEIVAKKLFGWTHGGSWGYPNYIDPNGSGILLIVNQMRVLGFNSFNFAGYYDDYRVEFVCNSGPCLLHNSNENNWHGGTGYAKNLPRAVCLAALDAVKGL